MKSKFNIVEGFVPATPRSQRKKNATGGGGNTIVFEGSSEGNSSLDPNSHTHTNLPLLESLADQDGYLTRKEGNPDTAEDADPFVYTKVKAGFSDKSGDSEKWSGKSFADYMDQPVRKSDAVEHRSVTVTDSVASKDFRKGDFSGSGFGMYIDANGNAVAEVDILKARKEAVFNTVVINQVTFQVGATVFSNGGCEIARVEELDDVYRCYYDTKEGRRLCGLVVDDQVRCQRYDATQNRIVKYYWRLVVAVGEDYVDLSKTDVDGMGVPEAGDEIAQFGHRTDKTRQGATIIDPKDGSSVVVYSEINSYSLVKKNFVGLGTNPQTGRPYLYCYGDFFLGDRELKNQFLTFQIPEGQTVPQLIGELNIRLGAGSSGLDNLSEWADKQQQIDDAGQAASDAQDTANEAQNTANTAQNTANTAQNTVNNLEIGVDNLVDKSNADWAEAAGASGGYKDGIYRTINGQLIRGKKIYFRVELKGEEAQATSLGYEIFIAFADGTKRWIGRYGSSHVPERGTFEKTYVSHDTIEDKEITEARIYPVLYTLGGTTSGKLYIRHEFVAVGNKLPSTWVPSVNDQKQAAIDGVQIGGVNVLNDSELMSSWTKSNTNVTPGEVAGYKCLLNKTNSGGVYTFTAMTPDAIYTPSIWVYGTSTKCFIRFGIEQAEHYSNVYLTESMVNKWVRLVLETQTAWKNSQITVAYFGVDGAIEPGDDFMAVRNFQIEEGTKATTWNKSPADVQSEIDQVQQTVSDLDYLTQVFPNSLDVNGVVLAQLMGVKSSTAADAAVVAGFYGGSDATLNNAGFTDPTHGILMMFAGAQNVQSVASAKTRVYGDGSIFTQMLYANGGQIGGFAISDYSMQADTYIDPNSPNSAPTVLSSLYMSADLLRYTGTPNTQVPVAEPHTMDVRIGTSTQPGVSGLKCPVHVQVSTSYPGAVAAGLFIDVQNTLGVGDDSNAAYGSHAMMIAHGDICGLRLRTRRVKTYTILSDYDNVILCAPGSTKYSIVLPSDPQDGHILFIKSVGGSYYLQAPTGQYINKGLEYRDTTWDIGENGRLIIMVFDKVNKVWHAGHTSWN